MRKRIPRHLRTPRPDIDPEAERYYIYRLYGAEGLLYIGRSCRPLERLKGHHAASDWAAKVVQIEGHGPYTWDEAVKRKRDEILRKRPPHNIDGVTKKTGGNVPLVRASVNQCLAPHDFGDMAVRCVRNAGHDGRHGYAGMFWSREEWKP